MANIYSMADVWNDGATTFDAIRMDVTDTASDAASRLLWLGVDGSAKATIDKAGSGILSGGLTLGATSLLRLGGATSSYPALKRNGSGIQARLADDSALAAVDVLSLATGSVANAVALAATQTLSAANAQSILDLAATWNTSGTPTALKVNITDTASNAASLLADFQVGGASKLSMSKAGAMLVSAGTSSVPTISFVGDPDTGLYNASANAIGMTLAGNLNHLFSSTNYTMHSSFFLGWGSSATNTPDVRLFRDAVATLAQRNGTAAQASRLYFSYTDASNYTRMAFKTATGVHTIETESAGTGEANIDLALVPKGTGAVRFGTHAAIGAETVTGYITIKDAGGTSRKVAVVS